MAREGSHLTTDAWQRAGRARGCGCRDARDHPGMLPAEASNRTGAEQTAAVTQRLTRVRLCPILRQLSSMQLRSTQRNRTPQWDPQEATEDNVVSIVYQKQRFNGLQQTPSSSRSTASKPHTNGAKPEPPTAIQWPLRSPARTMASRLSP